MVEIIMPRNRIVRRVPLDFPYPLNAVWKGWAPDIGDMRKIPELVERVPELMEFDPDGGYCCQCEVKHRCSESARYCVWYNQENVALWKKDPPVGDGYQLWETTTEGSPVSPVFESLEALCAWCAENATVFADIKATKEQWRVFLGDS